MAFGEQKTIKLKVKVGSGGQLEKKDQLVEVRREFAKVSGAKALDMKDYNQSLKDLRTQEKELLDTIANGIAEVDVDVVERLNDKLQQVETFRVDTGKIIPELTRPLNQEERQLSIEDLDPKGTGKTATSKAAPAGKPAKAKGPAKSKGKGGRGARSAGASAE